MSYGTLLKFGVARQTNPGSYVTVATSFHPLPVLSENVGMEFKELISQNLIGRFDQGASFQGVTNVNGTIQMEITPRNLGVMLAGCMDWSPNSGGTGQPTYVGSACQYVFVPNTSDFGNVSPGAPWTLYKQWSDSTSAELFYDCQFGELEFNITQGQFAKGVLTVTGGTRLPNGVGSLAIQPVGTDVGQLDPWVVASLSYGGNGLSNFSDIMIHLNENIEPLYTLNASLAPFKFTRKSFREVTVDGTFYMNDRSMLNNFASNTLQRLLVTLTNTLATISSGYYNQLVIDVPQLKITAFKPGTSGPGEVSVKFTGRGIMDPASYYSIQATLTNTWAAGY